MEEFASKTKGIIYSITKKQPDRWFATIRTYGITEDQIREKIGEDLTTQNASDNLAYHNWEFAKGAFFNIGTLGLLLLLLLVCLVIWVMYAYYQNDAPKFDKLIKRARVVRRVVSALLWASTSLYIIKVWCPAVIGPFWAALLVLTPPISIAILFLIHDERKETKKLKDEKDSLEGVKPLLVLLVLAIFVIAVRYGTLSVIIAYMGYMHYFYEWSSLPPFMK